MKVLGSYLFNSITQRGISEGARLDVPRDQLREHVNKNAKIGDLLWVKEPFALITSRRFGPQNVQVVVPGGILTPVPDLLKNILHKLRLRRLPGSHLEKGDSRATLVIESITATALCCVVRMQQVDDLLAAGAGQKAVRP